MVVWVKDWISKTLTSGFVYKLKCGLCSESYYRECVRTTLEELVDILVYHHLPKTKLSKSSSIANHLLFCNHLPSYNSFGILKRENKDFLLELKENLLIMRDQPYLNRTDISAPFYLFDRA